MATIQDIIRISLIEQGTAVQPDNMNNCLLVTSDSNTLSTAERFRQYTLASQVANDFGTFSSVYEHAKVFFAQSPNPISVGGSLTIGYHRAIAETTTAKSAVLTGLELTDSLVSQLNLVTDGSFDIDVDGASQSLTLLDFSTAFDLSDIAVIINAALVGATCSLVANKLVITSSTTGLTSLLTNAYAGAVGTDLSVTLGLSAGIGASLVQGSASAVLPLETKQEAIQELSNQVGFKAFVFIDNTTDIEAIDLASWAEANGKLSYDVFDDVVNHLANVSTNPVVQIRIAKLQKYRMLFSALGNRKLATAYMSRLHAQNLSGTNTAITMNLKELVGVAYEVYTSTQESTIERLGMDCLVNYSGVGKLKTSGANGWSDDVYNKEAIKVKLATDTFNYVANVGTKVAQTQKGVDSIVSVIKGALETFVTSGVASAGTWLSATFGDDSQFRDSISTLGYFVYANPLSSQTSADRVARKSPLIQIALKFAGAVHSVDITLEIEL